MSEGTCSHIDAIASIKQTERRECAECIKIGAKWISPWQFHGTSLTNRVPSSAILCGKLLARRVPFWLLVTRGLPEF